MAARHGLAARNCRVIKASGESMKPTLGDGCSILVNLVARRRHVGLIFVIRTGDSLVAKRARKRPSGAWQIVSDNPNKQVWPNAALARPTPRPSGPSGGPCELSGEQSNHEPQRQP